MCVVRLTVRDTEFNPILSLKDEETVIADYVGKLPNRLRSEGFDPHKVVVLVDRSYAGTAELDGQPAISG